MKLKAWFCPWPTVTVPDGLMLPPTPAEAAMVYVSAENYAVTVRLLVMLRSVLRLLVFPSLQPVNYNPALGTAVTTVPLPP